MNATKEIGIAPRGLAALFLASSVALGAGCSGPERLPGGSPDAGAGDAPDAGADAPTRTSAVTGRRFERCRQVPADVDIPVDLSPSYLTVRALVLDPAGGYREIKGTGHADGGFYIPDVPEGVTYLLQIDRAYYETAERHVEIRSERTYRCAPAPQLAHDLPDPVTVSYALDAMTEVSQPGPQRGEWLDLASLAFGFFPEASLEPLRDGDTSTAGSIDWRTCGHTALPPMIEAARGDDLLLLHHVWQWERDPETRRVRTFTTLADWFDATGRTLRSGEEVSLTGSFAKASPRSLSYAFDRALLDAASDGLLSWSSLTVRLMAHPRWITASGAPLLDLDLSDDSHTDSAVLSVTSLPYGDPFPASWQRTLYVGYNASRVVANPGYLSNFEVPVRNQQLVPFAAAEAGQPLLPPAEVTLDGQDFERGGKLPFTGEAPLTLRWSPSAGANTYLITIYNLDTNAPNGIIATLWTSGTSLRIPAEILRRGPYLGYFNQSQWNMFVLEAIQSPADLRRGQALAEPDYVADLRTHLPAPIRIAGIASGRFHLTARCGDEEIQTSEEERCDDGGESATCNADCTAASCGDGLHNAAAGEECDTAGFSASCDPDCTLQRCGDGNVNYLVEDCDDGNTLDDDNGCSVACKYNNTCGDGVIEDIIEICDPGAAGETATCDVDCTAAFCGDNYINTAAGEECDQSFDPTCQGCRIVQPPGARAARGTR
jgi:hypothetical protein